MKNLTKKEYWDSLYSEMEKDKNDKSIFSSFKKWIKHKTRDYSNYLIWDVILPKYLTLPEKKKIIEIGCAPGKYLINFKNNFGFDPYGVEYSEEGARIAKQNFNKNGINPDHIIKADFFDQNFQDRYKENFDLVFSRGFIEHFDNPENAVSGHLNLVKTGGLVVISIPNLSGVNRFIARRMNIDSFILHNTSIMNKEKFCKLFPADKLETIFCGYVGIFSFGLFNTKTNREWRYYTYRILLLLQRSFDLLLRLLFGRVNLIKSRFSSPYLLYIGIKK